MNVSIPVGHPYYDRHRIVLTQFQLDQAQPVNWHQDEEDGYVNVFSPENIELYETVTTPGTLVWFSDGAVELIGSINMQLGKCSCCNADITRAISYLQLLNTVKHKDK